MSFWGAIKKSINSELSTPLNTQMTGMESRLNTRINNFTVPVVKSVQRGVATDVAGSEYITVTIGAVNPAKCLVIVDGYVFTQDANNFMPMIVQSLTATTLTLQISSIYAAHNNRRDNVSWQVVEFY